MATKLKASGVGVDFEKFRLRTFVQKLDEIGELKRHDAPISLADLSRAIEAATPQASYFKTVGKEGYEMVAAVAGSRKRLAAAFGSNDERDLAHEQMRRLAKPQPIIEVESADAPVHHTVIKGDDIDLNKLPFHVQHECDGGAYISSGIDFSVDPATGKPNVGCRRLMLRSKNTMRSNLSGFSDLRRIYLGCVARGEKLPVTFAIGSHPLDYLAAGLKLPVDEFGLVATLRGEPVPMVRGLTNGILAPADAEMTIEGYFDELGYRELEGPYGEFMGYYGPVHIDPVFHVTAVTMRKDPLFQTVFHSGRMLSRTDSGNLGAVNAEVRMWRTLRAAHIEPTAVRCIAAANGRQHVRVALKPTVPGQARLAIAALFAIPFVKHVFIVDDDVDVFSDEQMEWAMCIRFRADRDIVLGEGYPAQYMDVMTDKDTRTLTKAGFDLTAPFDYPKTIEVRTPKAPVYDKAAKRCKTAREALAEGPMFFAQIMEAVGSEDGREISMELDELREAGLLTRLEPNGEWLLKADEAKYARPVAAKGHH